jgi:hypothetical protein
MVQLVWQQLAQKACHMRQKPAESCQQNVKRLGAAICSSIALLQGHPLPHNCSRGRGNLTAAADSYDESVPAQTEQVFQLSLHAHLQLPYACLSTVQA